MKILVIGGGGREHALAWKLAESPKSTKVYVAPGNGGTGLAGGKVENLNITDPQALREWAQAEKVALTVVGPEAPLAAGVVDEFRAHGLRIFGPSKAAAQLESSKAFSKDFMARHGIPTALYETFTDPVAAHAYVDRLGAPIVVKADGLAAGKGVVVATTLQEAHDAVDFMLVDNKYGVAHNDGGARVVIEEFLAGEEASFIVLCDGKNVLALATKQRNLLERRFRDGQGNDRHVEPGFEQVLNKFLRHGLTRPSFQVRIMAGQRLDDLRQQIGRDRRDDPDPQPTAERALTGARQILQFIHRTQDRPRTLGKFFTKGGQPDLAAATLDKRRTYQFLQFPDLQRKCRLRDGARFRRAPEMANLCQRVKITEVLHR